MFRNYKYRLYPTDQQQAVLGEIFFSAWWLYNQSLHYRRKYWQESRRSTSYYDQCAIWSKWRNEDPKNNPLQLLNATAGRQVLRRLDDTYREFKKGKRGYPRFKQLRRFSCVPYVWKNGVRLVDNRLYIQNVGAVRVRWHRDLPDGKIKRAMIVRKPSGWYGVFQIELPEQPIPVRTEPPVGIDIGLKHALALSDGTVFDSPKYLEQSLMKLRRLQRRVARRKKGSNRRRKAVLLLAKHMEKISNQRRDWWHKVTRELVDQYGAIVLEELSLEFMLQNKHLARVSRDVSLGLFRQLLDYKAEADGVDIIGVNPAGTSQMCSSCGALVPKDLKVRVHDCPECGLCIDRDLNSAINILSAGTQPSGANVGR